MKNQKTLTLFTLLFAFWLTETTAQKNPSKLTQDEINTMNAALKADSNLYKMIGWFGEPVDLYENYKVNLKQADSIIPWKKNEILPGFTNMLLSASCHGNV